MEQEKNRLPDTKYLNAANAIKEAILSAQYEAARGVNNIQLMLYYAIGRYISANSRKGYWGTDAIGTISRLIRTDLPGIRGYSESNIKRMRNFYEEWRELDPLNAEPNSPIQTGDLISNGKEVDNQSSIIPRSLSNDMPDRLRNALPDQEALIKLIDEE